MPRTPQRFEFAQQLAITTTLVIAPFLFGCSKAPEKTQDPAEIEQLRQKHEDMSHREMENEG